MFLQIAGGVLALGIAIYFIFLILYKKKSDSIKEEVLALLKDYGSMSFNGKEILFSTKTTTYQILFFYVPLFAELTINSKTKWEINKGGTSQLIDQSSFLSSDKEKLVIIYPTTIQIKRYINENEMVFIKPSDHFYQMHLIFKSELNNFLSEGIL